MIAELVNNKELTIKNRIPLDVTIEFCFSGVCRLIKLGVVSESCTMDELENYINIYLRTNLLGK